MRLILAAVAICQTVACAGPQRGVVTEHYSTFVEKSRNASGQLVFVQQLGGQSRSDAIYVDERQASAWFKQNAGIVVEGTATCRVSAINNSKHDCKVNYISDKSTKVSTAVENLLNITAASLLNYQEGEATLQFLFEDNSTSGTISCTIPACGFRHSERR
ncbi:hypothetical protein [Sphingomonas sp. SUN039]|uniref:hypothetical protein n=1 Tax=Sphingomonas sp. SUN039 TaxID=2937787 RepID=UPI002164ECA3|nr:hypothetical protein [Sphingomonas sp. SUN039]UVO54206.1 hypothetical protein M0209_08765 [Sphingomonas sp. SUN039]